MGYKDLKHAVAGKKEKDKGTYSEYSKIQFIWFWHNLFIYFLVVVVGWALCTFVKVSRLLKCQIS